MCEKIKKFLGSGCSKKNEFSVINSDTPIIFESSQKAIYQIVLEHKDKLTSKQFKALELYYGLNCSYSKTAKKLNISRRGVIYLIKRGRLRLISFGIQQLHKQANITKGFMS